MTDFNVVLLPNDALLGDDVYPRRIAPARSAVGGSPHRASAALNASPDPGPSRVRRRMSSPSPVANSASWWFEDGNVLLQAEDTLFKVHKSIISQAQVLKDTLELGSNLSGTGSVDRADGDNKLPTLPLQDRARDVELFLKAVYDWGSFVDTPPNVIDLRALLLLADKYDHPKILRRALELYKTAVAKHKRFWLDLFPCSSKERGGGHVPVSAAETWDTNLISCFYNSVVALVAIAVEARLHVKDELTWMYTMLAEGPAAGRHFRLSRTFNVDGWTVALDAQSLREIHFRIERTSPQLDHARAIILPSPRHYRSCTDSTCRRQLPHYYSTLGSQSPGRSLFSASDSTRASTERILGGFYAEKTTYGSQGILVGIKAECIGAVAEWCWGLLDRYDAEMAIGCDPVPAPNPVPVAPAPDA